MESTRQETPALSQAYQIIQQNALKAAAAKKVSDKIVKGIFAGITLLCSSIIVVVTFFILIKGLLPFIKTYSENGTAGKANLGYFLTGLRFNSGFDATSQSFFYGVGFLVVNTLYINLIVSLIAIPTAILTALFIARIAPKPLAKICQAGIDLLAAIPSVIYGIFGLGVIVPLVKAISQGLGMKGTSGISLLAGALILSLMALPTIISVSVTALNAVDDGQLKGSLALGASKTQTNFKIALVNAKSGIFAGIILGIGRSLGEATAISMVAGSPTYGITWNIFEPAVTLSSEMLLSIGEAVPNSLNYDVRFSAGIMLMLIIILTNLILNDVKDHVASIDKRPLAIVRFIHLLQRWFRYLGSFIRGKVHAN
jgi:phosphate transport system permease protein